MRTKQALTKTNLYFTYLSNALSLGQFSLQATKSEELLSSQLEQMNERFNVRMSNREDYVTQLDALKEEVST